MILIWQLIKLEWYYAFVRNFMMRSNVIVIDNVIFAVYWRLNFSHAAANPTWYRRQMKHIFLSLLIYQNIKNVWHIKSNAFARTIYKYTKWLGKSWECRRRCTTMQCHYMYVVMQFGLAFLFFFVIILNFLVNINEWTENICLFTQLVHVFRFQVRYCDALTHIRNKSSCLIN